MRIPVRAALLLCLPALGCSRDGASDLTATGTPAAPVVVNANGVVALTAGAAVTYDATRGGTCVSDPLAAGLTYRITLVAGR